MCLNIRCDGESCKVLEFWRELNKGIIFDAGVAMQCCQPATTSEAAVCWLKCSALQLLSLGHLLPHNISLLVRGKVKECTMIYGHPDSGRMWWICELWRHSYHTHLSVLRAAIGLAVSTSLCEVKVKTKVTLDFEFSREYASVDVLIGWFLLGSRTRSDIFRPSSNFEPSLYLMIHFSLLPTRILRNLLASS